MLRLKTLGGLKIDGARVVSVPPLILETLAVLALAGDRSVVEDDAIALLWPERPREEARAEFRALIASMGDLFGVQPTRLLQDGYRLDASQISSDVRDFEFAAASGAPDEASKLYAGPFLDQVRPPSPSFERWRQREAARLAQVYGWARDAVKPRKSSVTLAPGTRLGHGGRYRIEGQIGSGGAATVFAGHDARHDRPVAIKVLRQEISESISPERFTREIRLLAKLQHPHILPLFDSGEIGPTLFSVTPYVEGESVRQRLDRAGPYPVIEAVRLAHEVTDALAYAHEEGVVHRDVKPENILISNDHALLADFGIARKLAQQSDSGRITLPGMVLGSPWYMSPEQSSGEAELDGRSDVYSLAAVLYEMLCGKPPFHGEPPRRLMTLRLTEVPPVVSSMTKTPIPEVLDLTLKKALQPLPDDRSNARQFTDSLASCERALTRSGAVPVQAKPPGRFSSVLRSLIGRMTD